MHRDLSPYKLCGEADEETVHSTQNNNCITIRNEAREKIGFESSKEKRKASKKR